MTIIGTFGGQEDVDLQTIRNSAKQAGAGGLLETSGGPCTCPPGEQGPKGDTGATGPAGATGASGLNWKSTWDALVDYVANDAVFYGDSSWFAANNPPVGDVPSLTSAYWFPLAVAGKNGVDGVNGTNGTDGKDGKDGADGAPGATGATGAGYVDGGARFLWTGSKAYPINTAVNLTALPGLALVGTDTLGLTLGGGVLKVQPRGAERINLAVTVRVKCNFDGSTTATKQFELSLKRPDGVSDLHNDTVVKRSNSITANSTKAFNTYSEGTTDPFVVDGFRAYLSNGDDGTLTVTSVELNFSGRAK